MKKTITNFYQFMLCFCERANGWLEKHLIGSDFKCIKAEMLSNCTDEQAQKVNDFIAMLEGSGCNVSVTDNPNFSTEGVTYALVNFVDKGQTMHVVRMGHKSKPEQRSKIFI